LVGKPEVDDAIVAFNTARLRGPGGEKLCDAVLIMGGPPCQVHSDARARAPSDEELAASLTTVKANLRIVKRITDAAAAVPGGPLVAFVMENPAGRKKNSMHR
jgi:site-specific DNA-cytosine methylase